ncbi:hypothetical protein [Halorubrum distributum]|uniref:Uncharacterized protein n=1 Tax=Halorubrum distributum JCM 10247 TaxID=1227486 RepID=M0DLQ9_9EURY|nr:hypothetical protein [Halorubrum terrestre]ELZ35753.1 hypothetical protein C473_03499 [Halorubrum terrestre JCM 10247]
MPSLDEVKESIANSSANDWKFFDGPEQIYVYKPDPRIRIEQESGFDDGYLHTWTEMFPDSESDATGTFQVYFNSSPIDGFGVVWTDGGRIQVPDPRIQNTEVDDLDEYEFAFSQYQAAIGRAMSLDDFDKWFPGNRVEVLGTKFH